MKKKASTRAYGRKKPQLWPLCASTTATFASLALLSTLAMPAWAQADDGDDGGNDGVINPDLVAKIDQLEGVKIDQTNYTQYVTTGNPGAVSSPESLRKVFFIYNPSTKKFLSMGGYWGTHAALSDTPHPFWIQIDTDDEREQYLTYPRREGEKLNIPSLMEDYFAAERVKVGSQEGNGQSHATYKSILYVHTDEQGVKQTVDLLHRDLQKDGGDYKPNFTKFATDYITGTPFQGDGRVEVTLDLSTCWNPSQVKTIATDGKSHPENVLSIGTNIDKWGKGDVNNGSGENLHFYYWKDEAPRKSNNTVKGNLQIDYVNSTWTDARRLYLTVKDGEIRVVVSRGGVVVYYTDSEGESQAATFFPTISVSYKAGKENQTVYFQKNADGTLKVDKDGTVYPDATLDATTGVPYVWTGPVSADGDPLSQRFFISTAIEKPDGSYDVEGKYLSFACQTGSEPQYSVGAYTDRQVGKTGLGLGGYYDVNESKKMAQWLLDYVEGDNKNLCYLSLAMPFDDKGVYDGTTGDRTFYLRPSAEYVKGPGPNDQNVYYRFDTSKTGNYTDRNQADQADLYADTEHSGDIMKWKIVTALDYYNAAMDVKQELTNTTDLSFLVMDNGFRRDNGYVKAWNIDGQLDSSDEEIAAGKARLRIGVDQYYKTNPKDNFYRNADGKTLSKDDSKAYNQELYNHSRYSGVCITNGGYGDFYQDVTVYAPGWYTVACKGISNAEAVLYAVSGSNRKAASLASITNAMSTLIAVQDAKDCYWPLDVNHPIYNSVALMADPYVKATDKDDNFETKLWIYVPGASQTDPKKLRIGVFVPKPTGTAELAADGDQERATPGADLPDWTVFTDFRLYYGGQTNETQYLVLDEDWTDYSVLESIQPINDTRTLCLNRRLKYGQWNTIILPVGLTQEQFQNTFGTGAELAKLTEMTDREIRFDRVQAEQAAEDGHKYWLMPNTPYIILPEIVGQEPEYTGTYTPVNGSGDFNITVPQGHYKIPGVQFTAPYIPTVTPTDGYTAWSMDYLKATVNGTTYPYLVSTAAVSGPADEGETAPTLTAYGMLAANYTEDDGVKKPVQGRYQLNDAYVMSKNALTRLSAEGTASKGYRCFFAYRGKDGGTEIPTLYIDGVSQVTLGIDDILAADRADQAATAPRREGVYTLQGQQLRTTSDTAGLPAGLYIVGGRKVLVK